MLHLNSVPFRIDLNAYGLEDVIAMKAGDRVASIIRYALENAARDCDALALGCAAQYAFEPMAVSQAVGALRLARQFQGQADDARAALNALEAEEG